MTILGELFLKTITFLPITMTGVNCTACVPGRVSRSLNLEQSAWYSHVLFGFTSGGGVQHTLSLIPARKQTTCVNQSQSNASVTHELNISLTIHHISLLHVALTMHVPSLATNHWLVVGHYSNLKNIKRPLVCLQVLSKTAWKHKITSRLL